MRGKLEGLLLGYKTRRILKCHKAVSKLKLEYEDLLSFAFELRVELRQLSVGKEKCVQPNQIKQLLVQSVKDLNSKRAQFNQSKRSVKKQDAGYYFEKIDWLH